MHPVDLVNAMEYGIQDTESGYIK